MDRTLRLSLYLRRPEKVGSMQHLLIISFMVFMIRSAQKLMPHTVLSKANLAEPAHKVVDERTKMVENRTSAHSSLCLISRHSCASKWLFG